MPIFTSMCLWVEIGPLATMKQTYIKTYRQMYMRAGMRAYNTNKHVIGYTQTTQTRPVYTQVTQA